MDAFAIAFAMIFLAELGDKSQLVALAFATRYRATTVLVAVAGATLILLGLSVLIGATVATLLPTALIQVAAGLVFLVFAAWTLRGDRDDATDEMAEGIADLAADQGTVAGGSTASVSSRDGDPAADAAGDAARGVPSASAPPSGVRGERSALLSIASAFFLSELGDKTMLATITLAAAGQPLATWLGASAGMITVDAIAIVIGAFLGSRLPERAVQLMAAAAFVVFGLLLIAEGLGLL